MAAGNWVLDVSATPKSCLACRVLTIPAVRADGPAVGADADEEDDGASPSPQAATKKARPIPNKNRFMLLLAARQV